MKIHPIADVFPKMTAKDFRELVDDIKENGLIEAIVVHEGQIVDGRHRWRACKAAKVTPRTVPWDGSGGSLVAWVMSKNLTRRHLSRSQRAQVALKLIPLVQKEREEVQKEEGRKGGKKGGRPRKKPLDKKVVQGFSSGNLDKKGKEAPKKRADRSADIVGKMVGVSRETIRQAKSTKTKAPDLEPVIQEGRLSQADASKLAKYPKRVRDQIISREEEAGSIRKALLKYEAEQRKKGKTPAPKASPAKLRTALTQAKTKSEALLKHMTDVLLLAGELKQLPIGRGEGIKTIESNIKGAQQALDKILGRTP